MRILQIIGSALVGASIGFNPAAAQELPAPPAAAPAQIIGPLYAYGPVGVYPLRPSLAEPSPSPPRRYADRNRWYGDRAYPYRRGYGYTDRPRWRQPYGGRYAQRRYDRYDRYDYDYRAPPRYAARVITPRWYRGPEQAAVVYPGWRY